MSNNFGQRPFFIVIIILLLLINGALFYFNQQEKNKTVEQAEAIEDLSDDIAIKKRQLTEQRDSLEALNDQLADGDSVSVQLQTELSKLNSYIATLDKKSNFSQQKLSEAQSQIEYYSGLVENFKLQVGQLKMANERMAEQIQVEQTEKTQLKQEVEKRTLDIQNLSSEKEQVTSVATKLSEEKQALEGRLEKASVLQLSRAYLNPYRTARKSKNVTTEKAKKTERIEACIEIVPNSEAQVGNQDFTVIITDPQGNVLPAAQNGNGNFATAEGESKRYTEVMTAAYNGKQGVFCGNWAEPQFLVGTYTLEVFNKGVLVGSNKVRLD